MVDKTDYAASHWGIDLNEGNNHIGWHCDKVSPVVSTKALREVRQGDSNPDLVEVRQVYRKGFQEEVKQKLQEWYSLARDSELFPASRWQKQHVQSHKGSGQFPTTPPVCGTQLTPSRSNFAKSKWV